MALFEDDRPKRKVLHEIGQDISLLSVSELDERMELLRLEIDRLAAERSQKDSSKAAAQALFR